MYACAVMAKVGVNICRMEFYFSLSFICDRIDLIYFVHRVVRMFRGNFEEI